MLKAKRLSQYLGLLLVGLFLLVGNWAICADDGGTAVLLDEKFDRDRAVAPFKVYNYVSDSLLNQINEAGGWHLILGSSSDAKAWSAGGAVSLQIERSGSDWYAVQLCYLPLMIQPNKLYQVSFKARADREVFTTFDLGRVGADWRSYSNRLKFNITGEWQNYQLKFATNKIDYEENARLEFNFGDVQQNTIYFDDVKVTEEPKKK